MSADEPPEFMHRPDMQLLMKLTTVSHTVKRAIQAYCHYETVVRQDQFLQRLPVDSGARTALSSLRRMVTSELTIILTALWEQPKNKDDFLDKESFPALLGYARKSEVVEALKSYGAFDGMLSDLETEWAKAYRLLSKIERSTRFKNQKNHRDRENAHRLRQTNFERKGLVFETPTHGDLELLFVLTIWCDRYLWASIRPAIEKRTVKAILSPERSNVREMWKCFNRRIDTFNEPFGH